MATCNSSKTRSGNPCGNRVKEADMLCHLHRDKKVAFTTDVAISGSLAEAIEAKVEEYTLIAPVQRRGKTVKITLTPVILATNGEERLIHVDGKTQNLGLPMPHAEYELAKNEGEVYYKISFAHSVGAEILAEYVEFVSNIPYSFRSVDDTKGVIQVIEDSKGNVRDFARYKLTTKKKGVKRSSTIGHVTDCFGQFIPVFGPRPKSGRASERHVYINVVDQVHSDSNPNGLLKEDIDGSFTANDWFLNQMSKNITDEERIVLAQTAGVFGSGRIGLKMDGKPVLFKGDIDRGKTGMHDIEIDRCNIVDDFGLTDDDVMVASALPYRQFEKAMTNMQFNASFHQAFLGQRHPDHPQLTVWEYMVLRTFGWATGRTMLGQNVWFEPTPTTDPEEAVVGYIGDYYKGAAIMNEMFGSTLASVHHTFMAVKNTMSSFTKDDIKKEQLAIPTAGFASLKSPYTLHKAGYKGDLPHGNRVALSFNYGVIPGTDILSEFYSSAGGADKDDHIAVIPFVAMDDFEFHGYEYKEGDFLLLFVRYPLGGRIHEGKVGMEFWIAEPHTDGHTQKVIDHLVGQSSPLELDPNKLPYHVLDLPAPEHTEAVMPKKRPMFEDELRAACDTLYVYDKFSARFTSLVEIAGMHGFDISNLIVDAEEDMEGQVDRKVLFSVPVTAEWAIDTSTSHRDRASLFFLAEVTDANEAMIKEMVLKMNEVDWNFAFRGGLIKWVYGKPVLKVKVPIKDWAMTARSTTYNEALKRMETVLNEGFLKRYMGAMSGMVLDQQLRSSTLVGDILDAYSEHSPKSKDTRLIEEARYKAASLVSENDYTDAEVYEAWLMQAHMGVVPQWKQSEWEGQAKLSAILFNPGMFWTTVSALNENEGWLKSMMDGLNQHLYLPILHRYGQEGTLDVFQQSTLRAFMRSAKHELANEVVLWPLDASDGDLHKAYTNVEDHPFAEVTADVEERQEPDYPALTEIALPQQEETEEPEGPVLSEHNLLQGINPN